MSKNIVDICNAYKNGVSDGIAGNNKQQQGNFNLQDAYDYGYTEMERTSDDNNDDDRLAG
jgi:hypothetical protein